MTSADVFLRLLNAALHEASPGDLGTSINWSEVYGLAQQHRVVGLLLTPVLSAQPGPPPEILTAWQEHAMLTLLQQTQYVDLLSTVLAAFDAAGLRAVIMKGVALKLLYPEPDMRTMSDADLLIAPEQFEAGCALLLEHGFVKHEGDSTEAAFECDHPVGLRIELHQRLFDRKQHGFLAKLNEADFFNITLAQRMPVYGGEAYVFPHTEHALFMLLHMAKHMIVTGFGLRQVSDMSLFVEKYDAQINWPRFWKIACDLELQRFTAALLTLCHLRLSLPRGQWMETQPVPMDPEASELLLMDLLEAGVFGKSTQERTRSAAVVYRSFDHDSAATDNRLLRLARAVFIRPSELKAPYLYAKKHPILLPAAWAHRLYRFLFRQEGRPREELTQGLRIAEERLRLLNKLGMRE